MAKSKGDDHQWPHVFLYVTYRYTTFSTASEEECLLGYQPLHSLKDALRVWLATNPLEAEQIRQINPYGPLAVSYDRGQGTSTPCRYDFIYSTSDFSVAQIRYLYNEALRARSDHALVVADLVVSLKN